MLSGGDRRSIARSNEVLPLALGDPELVDELAKLAKDPDWLVAMRSVDLLDKVVRAHPEWVQPHRRLFLELLNDEHWEIRLQCVRTAPLLEWTEQERKELLLNLSRMIDDDQKFVQAWALDAFALLSGPNEQGHLLAALHRFLETGSPALKARAKAIVKRLQKAN